jgi:hypothetical protein
MGTDVSYETVITAEDVVYENFFLLTSSNNYFYIRASYDVNGGVYSIVANEDDDSLYYRHKGCAGFGGEYWIYDV